jgi:YVTN family beta-propeller protein
VTIDTAPIRHVSFLITVIVFWGAVSVASAQPFAYVAGANRGMQILTVINIATNAKVTTIPLGVGCNCGTQNSVVASPDGSRVYAANSAAGTISVISAATNTVIDTIAAGPQPVAITISPDGARLYAVSSGFVAVVHVIDVATHAVLATIPLGMPQVHGITVTPDGRRLYVTTFDGGITRSHPVKVIDTVSNTVVASVLVGDFPMGLDVTPDGSLVYVAVRHLNAAVAISTATNSIVASIRVGFNPQSARVSVDGTRVYVANNGSPFTISVINRFTNTVATAVNGAYHMSTIALAPNGAVALAGGEDRVVAMNTITNTITGTILFDPAAEGRPTAIAIPASLPPAPDPPSDLLASSIVGNDVTLRWNAPATGPAPTNYTLEGGLNPGQTLASLSTGGATPTFTFTAPTGAFYIRLHALVGASKSAASNEIHIVVPGGGCTAPSTPANFQVSKAGTTIFVSWDASTSGPPPTGYLLHVTGTLVGSFATPNRSLSGAVGPGTYGLSVAATTACGSSAPTPVQNVTIP